MSSWCFLATFSLKKHTIHRNQSPSASPYDSSHSFSKKQTFLGLVSQKTLLLKFTYCETSAVILEWDSHLIHHTSSAFDLWRGGVSTLLSGFYLYTLVWTWPSGSCFVSRSKSCLTTDHAIKVSSFIRNVKSEVACSQVWWPIQGICALHLTHLSAHTHTHTHTLWTQCCGARGSVGGSVACSTVSPQSWYWRWRKRWLFTLSTNNCWRTWDSNPCPPFRLQVRLSIH